MQGGPGDWKGPCVYILPLRVWSAQKLELASYLCSSSMRQYVLQCMSVC